MKARISNVGRRGFTLIEVLVVLAVLGLLAAVMLPQLARRYAKSSRANCTNNLKQIGLGFHTWSTDNGDKYPMGVLKNSDGTRITVNRSNMFIFYQVMSKELNNPRILVCPNDTRLAATNFESLSNTNISYYVGLDADETRPKMILLGDRNLTTNGVAVGPGLLELTSAETVGFTGGMHINSGNVALADGSVQQVPKGPLQKILQSTGTNVNRLAIP